MTIIHVLTSTAKPLPLKKTGKIVKVKVKAFGKTYTWKVRR